LAGVVAWLAQVPGRNPHAAKNTIPFEQIRGIKTRYEVLGEGPPLLLLAPVGFEDPISRRWADRVWRGFRPVEALVPRFQLILYDRRETGGTGGCVEPLSWALCARHAKDLLDHLGIDQAFLLGGCVGCSVALALAAEFPERCRALLLHWPVGGYHWLNRGRANFDRHIAFVRAHGLKGVAELARRSKVFWSDPDAGPWSSSIASDDAFAESFVRQDLDQYLSIVEQSRDNLFSDTLPAGATCEQLVAMRVPAFIMPGNDVLHTASCAHTLRELMPQAALSPLKPSQQNAVSIANWIYESSGVVPAAARPGMAA
jgi:pimeloyl-ACP methyl ester carboxylesterase